AVADFKLLAERAQLVGRERIVRRSGSGSALANPARDDLRIDTVVVGDLLGELAAKLAFHRAQRDAVLRPARPGHARLDLPQVKLERAGEYGIGRRRGAEQP